MLIVSRINLVSSRSSLSTSTSKSYQTSRHLLRTRHRGSPKVYSRLFMLIFLLIILPTIAESATFFYGAADLENTSQITKDEYETVFHFCQVLPRLESMGKVKKNLKTQQICEKLVKVLAPMFQD